MFRLLAVLTVAGLLMASPVAAQQLFDFDGQALIPGSVGGTATMYSVVLPPSGSLTTPLPLDFANFEYTIVVTGLTLDVDGNPQSYSGGAIALYEDDVTPADLNNPVTFVDGTPVLTGTVLTCERRIFFVSSGVGTATGQVDWTGGSAIDDIHPSDRLGWAFLVSVSGSQAEPGYDERWDGKVEPQTPIVGTEVQSFGSVKGRF